MSSFLLHGLMWGIPVRFLRISWRVTAILTLVGMAPDFGTVVRWFTGNWDVYVWLHTFHWWTYLLPPYWLHLAFDSVMHDYSITWGVGFWGWNLIAWGLEIPFWVLVILERKKIWEKIKG